jgi:hypothetical protein
MDIAQTKFNAGSSKDMFALLKYTSLVGFKSMGFRFIPEAYDQEVG